MISSIILKLTVPVCRIAGKTLNATFQRAMPIPNAESAFIPPEKLGDYLLNLAHPVGGPKARWFVSIGYHPGNPDQLESDLLEIVRNSVDYVVEETRFGVKYVVSGQLRTPNGNLASVRTVWITESDVPQPRLVTAYPEDTK